MVLRVPTMRNGTSVLVLVAMAFLGGCASKENVAAKTPAPHISVAMDEETHRALLGLVEDDDSGPVGTTTLTGADIYLAPAATSATSAAPATSASSTAADGAQALPDERGSLSVLRTWGDAPPTEVDGIPTSRE